MTLKLIPLLYTANKKNINIFIHTNMDVNRIMWSFVCYLNTEGLLGLPATSGPSVVLWREGVSDAQLLAHPLKGVIANQPQVFQKLFPLVNGHEHSPLVRFVLTWEKNTLRMESDFRCEVLKPS